MVVKQSSYEALLAEYSDREAAIALLTQYRPYLSMIPSMRRPEESLITIPLPVARLKREHPNGQQSGKKMVTTQILPCDVAILMCDPEWKIKLDVEIMVFIHRPEEDFSELLLRWRHTQVYLDQDYEWLMPEQDNHMLSDTAEQIYPLFVIFPETPDRIAKGLKGANLPFIVKSQSYSESDVYAAVLPSEG